MKIKHITVILLFALLPVLSVATDNNSFDTDCDNIIYNEAYDLYYGTEKLTRLYKDILGGENKDKGKFAYDIIALCNEKDCQLATFGGRKLFGKESPKLNMISFALYMDNRPVFNEILLNLPEMKDMIDTGLYTSDPDYSNSQFYTPTLRAVEEGQIGVVKLLDTEYDINFLKKGGRISSNPNLLERQDLRTAIKIAENAVEKWKTEKNTTRLACAKETLEYVKQRYKEQEKDPRKVAEAKEYNDNLDAIAKQIKYMSEAEPIEFPEFTPITPLIRLQGIEKSYAQRVVEELDALIENLASIYADLSDFGNQA